MEPSSALRILFGGLCALGCGGVDTPDGEPTSLPAGATQPVLAGSAQPMPAAAPSPSDEARPEAISEPPPNVADDRPSLTASLPPPVFCDAPTKVLVASCGNGSCHSNSGAVIGDFAVDAERAYNFVDKVSVRHASCGRIIDSQDYSKSLLLTKVRGTFPSPDCGGRMPVGSFTITEEQIDCLASWLQQFQAAH